MDFRGYTKAAIEAAMLDQVDDSLDKREGSLIQTAIAPVAWFLEGLYMVLGQMWLNANPNEATGEALDNMVALRGLTRKVATAAVRQGTFDVQIPVGSQFKTINGADSVVFTSGDLISHSAGSYSYMMTCETPGTIGNSYTGPLLPVTAIAGLTSAYLGVTITEGTEEESDTALRERFFESFESQAYGGNLAEYRQAILAIQGVGAVQIYPVWQGGGTVLCSILGSDFLPASQTLIDTVQEIICPPKQGETEPSDEGYGIAPIGAKVTISTATEVEIDVECTVAFSVANGLETYREQIEGAIRQYIASVREEWGKPLVARRISYPVSIYAARMIYAILSIPEVTNVTDLKINGQSGDLSLTETAVLQQVPTVGVIVIND